MNLGIDTIIVGAGLAGASAALYLSQRERVLVLEAGQPASGASGVAAGVVNPLMGLRVKRAWRIEEALEALTQTLDLAQAQACFTQEGLLRPAIDAEQAERFLEVIEKLPGEAEGFAPEAAKERFPEVAAEYGAIVVRRGGAMQVPAFVNAMLQKALQQGAAVMQEAPVVAWGEAADRAFVEIIQDDQRVRYEAQRVILALGHGYHRFSELDMLDLHDVKGQMISLSKPAGFSLSLPVVGHGYLVPEGDQVMAGSTYERGFDHTGPTPEGIALLHEQAARMVPAIKEATLQQATAGIRVTVPGIRLPMLGRLPGRSHLWIFTGLGSKGLLMAPLLAPQLHLFFEKPELIPREIRVRLQRF